MSEMFMIAPSTFAHSKVKGTIRSPCVVRLLYWSPFHGRGWRRRSYLSLWSA